MLRKVLGVISSFFIWIVVWFGCEMVLASIWPEWFGGQLREFQKAIEDGSKFAPNTNFLVTQLAYGIAVSLISGFFCALISGENRTTPYILAVILGALALLKSILTWNLIPLWFHIAFSAAVIIMPILGSRSRAFSGQVTA